VATVIFREPAPADVNTVLVFAGAPAVWIVTTPAKPPTPATDIVKAALPPRVTLCDDGVAERVKPAGIVTLRLSATLLLRSSLTPRTVSGIVPATAVVEAVSCSVDVPPKAITGGANVAVTPAGSPVNDKTTLAVKPPEAPKLIIDLVEDPCCRVSSSGAAARVNPGVAACAAQE